MVNIRLMKGLSFESSLLANGRSEEVINIFGQLLVAIDKEVISCGNLRVRMLLLIAEQLGRERALALVESHGVMMSSLRRLEKALKKDTSRKTLGIPSNL